MKTPRWFETAVERLLAGATIAEAARSCGVRRETISRALSRPDSPLRAEVERRRTASAPQSADLVEKARAVIGQHLDSQDPRSQLDAAKVVVGKLAPQQPAQPEPAEEEISAADAVREIAAALPAMKVLMREHPEAFSPEVAEELRAGCRKLAADLDAMAAPPQAPPAPPSPPRPAGPLLN